MCIKFTNQATVIKLFPFIPLYQLDQPKKAASAAYTHFLAHPDDEDSKNNVVYYRDFTNVAESDFVDLEMLPYKVMA